MVKIKLLKDYDGRKAGETCTVDSQEDADLLIEQGIAEKVIDTGDEPIDPAAMAKEIADKLKTELIAEMKIPAQPKPNKSDNPYKSFGEFCMAVVKPDEKLYNFQKATGMSESLNPDGGFLIPAEFSTALLTAMKAKGQLAPRCTNFPANHNLSLPFVNITSQALSWTGGVRIYKPGEGVAKTGSKPALAKANLVLNKMTALVYATDELIADSPVALGTFLTTMVSTEFALTKDEDIVNGSGAGECLGLMNAPCLVSVAKEGGQPAATLRYDNVAKMWARLYNPSRANAVWLINQDCMQQISKLSIVVGTGGGSVMVVNAATDIPQRIFGAPIIWSPHCQTLGTQGDIILADFSQYITLTKAGAGEMETATSIHIKFVEDETAFRFVVRFDGQPWWASAITPKHGNNTVTPFVTLDARE